MNDPTEYRPPVPPFTRQTAIEKIRKAEDAWNTCDPGQSGRCLAIRPTATGEIGASSSRAVPAIVEFLTRQNGERNPNISAH